MMFPGSKRQPTELAKLFVAAAQMAYAKASEIESVCRKNGALFFRFIDDKATDTQCFVAGNINDVVVSFRGTESIRDWVTDADFRMINRSVIADGKKVHHGFLHAFRAVEARVTSAILKARDNRQNIYFVGHSLGGAQAILSAYSWYQISDVSGVFTYGQPRVGNKNFCDGYNRSLGERTYRTINEEDIVPRLPGLLCGYRHVGNEIFFNAFGGMLINPSFGSKAFSDVEGLWNAWRAKRCVGAALDLLTDHRIEAYASRLGKL